MANRKHRSGAAKRRRAAPTQPSQAATGDRKARSVVRLPVWKKTLFALATTLLFFIVLECVLSAWGVQSVLYDEDPYVGFSSYIPLFVEKTEGDGTRVMLTARNKLRIFNPQKFPSDKGSGVQRIFCVGGSTTYGRPYDDHTSFCGWLREFLAVSDPTHEWEVINAGGISYASYRVALVMEELAEYEPDLFVIYSGHNEFLERRTYAEIRDTPQMLSGLTVLLSRTRTYSVAKRLFSGNAGEPAESTAQQDQLPAEVDAILDRSVGLDEYSRAELQKQEVLSHYRFNLERMVAIARGAGARVILVTPASKLRDCSPFKSEHRAGLSAADRQRWRTLFDAARQDMQQKRYGEALAKCDEAAKIDDRHAGLHYFRGRILLELGRHSEAKASLMRAQEEDVCPLRAINSMRSIVRETAERLDVPLVDFAALVEEESEHQIPGDNLFLDHVHPTIDGNRLLALSLLDEMDKAGIVQPVGTWNEATVQQVADRVLQAVDRQSHAVALRNLARVLKWAGKSEEAEKLAIEAIEINPADAESHVIIGSHLANQERFEEAVAHYRAALRIKPEYAKAHNNLGTALRGLGRHQEAVAHYQAALRIEPDYADAHNNLGTALQALGRPQEAVAHYRAALRIKPDYAEFHYNWGLALKALGRPQEAIAQYQAALRIKPDYAEVHNDWGLALQALGRPQEAVTQYQAALRIKPDLAKAHCNCGTALQALGRSQEAVAQYQTALRIKPDFAEVHYNWGNALARSGRFEEAISHYHDALRLNPDLAYVRKNLREAQTLLQQKHLPPKP